MHLEVGFFQVISHIFGHALGEGSDERALPTGNTLAQFRNQVINLTSRRPHTDLRIHQAGWADNLLHHLIGLFHLVRRGGGACVEGNAHHFFKFSEFERAVIQSGRQAEAVVHQGLLTGAISVIHAAQLGNHHVGFIKHHQVAAGHEIQ